MNISLSWLTQTDYNMNGKNLILKVNGTAVAAAKSCSIDTKCDLLEVSSPSDGAWRRFWVGRKEWSVSCSYLLTYENLTGVLEIGTIVTLVVQPLYGTTYHYAGEYGGTVVEYRASIYEGIYYHVTRMQFVALYNGEYFTAWEGMIDTPWFVTPQERANYVNNANNKLYRWNGTGLVFVPYLTGSAICEQCKMTGSVGTLANGSFQFKGSGPLSQVTS